jgi:hypothetical protein
MVGLLQGKLMDVSRRQYTSKKSGNEVNLYTIILYDEDGYKDSEKFFTATINSKLMDADKLLAQKDALMGKPVSSTPKQQPQPPQALRLLPTPLPQQ